MPFVNPNDDEDYESKFNVVVESGQWNNMEDDVNDPTDNKSSSDSK